MSSSNRKYMSKRQRPCDFCRSRKTACRIEGGLPCRLCALHERQCTFVEAAQPRKRPNHLTDNDVSSNAPLMEGQMSPPSPQPVPLAMAGPDQSAAAEPSANGLQSASLQAFSGLQHGSPMSSTSNYDHLFDNMDDPFSHVFETIDFDHQFPIRGSMQDGISPQEVQTLFGTQDSADCTENLHEPNLDRIDAANPQALGFSGDMDPYVLQNYQYDSNGSFGFKQLSIQSVLRGNFPVQFLISQPSLFSSSRKENGVQEISPLVARGELEKMVSSDTGRRLISLFRTFVLPLYPIFSETRFPDPDTSPAYLLAAIYLVGQLFARFDEALSIELAYETLDSQALFRLIHEALQYESHAPGLETVQTLLLLVIRPSTNPLVLESSVKWSLHGLLVSTAQSLGLHYDPTSWKLPRWQISLRRRIAFSIFSVDKWLACSLGRPPLVSTDNWLVIRLEKEDVHASTIESDTWSHFLYYTQLGIYMDEALTRLYSMRAIQELSSDPTKTLSIAREILEKTSQWHREFSQQSHNSEEPNPLSTISLLGYHYVQMTIFRAIMRPFLAKPGAASGAQHSLNGNSSTDIQSVLGLARTGFRSATTAALTFVKELKEEHSRIFWPHWSQVAFSSICFIDLMMATSSPDTDEAVCWFQDLHVARREMRLKSTMLPVLRLGLLRIDAVFWKGLSRVMHLEPHVEKALQESLKPTST